MAIHIITFFSGNDHVWTSFYNARLCVNCLCLLYNIRYDTHSGDWYMNCDVYNYDAPLPKPDL